MNKKITLFITISLVVLMCGSALAVNTPGVEKNHGVITVLMQENSTLSLGLEYGITSNIAFTGRYLSEEIILGAKYQLSNNFAVIGGLVSDDIYVGLNTAQNFTQRLKGTYEVDMFIYENDYYFPYQAGLIYDLEKNLDIRVGVNGSFDNLSNVGVTFGMGLVF